MRRNNFHGPEKKNNDDGDEGDDEMMVRGECGWMVGSVSDQWVCRPSSCGIRPCVPRGSPSTTREERQGVIPIKTSTAPGRGGKSDQRTTSDLTTSSGLPVSERVGRTQVAKLILIIDTVNKCQEREGEWKKEGSGREDG